MPTVVDVANLAGVSVATVSRVIQNSNRVSDEKRERVMKAIAELNYEISSSNNVTRMRSKTILVICGSCQDEFIDSIFEAAREHDYEVAVYYTAGHSLKTDTFIKKIMKNKTITGVITFGLTPSSQEALEEINAVVPVVQCCDELSLMNSFAVASDDVAIGHDAVMHLAEIGYKQIAFLGLGKMEKPFRYSEERAFGYRMGLTELNRPIDETMIFQCDLTKESVEKAMNKLLAMEKRPDAVFCVRDSTAIQLVNALSRLNIRIPEEIAVFGCGSEESAEQCWLPLSNVMHSYYEIGVEAINVMHNRITGKAVVGRRTNIQHKIVDRYTTRK